jgi:hypothetical protein
MWVGFEKPPTWINSKKQVYYSTEGNENQKRREIAPENATDHQELEKTEKRTRRRARELH